MLDQLFGIDIRSLALLRIGIALVSLLYLIELLPDFASFFSGDGVLPVELSKEVLNPSKSCYWSLYWFDDSIAFGQTLFSLHMFAAVLLLVGFQSRWVAGVCLVLTWSLSVRNPLIQQYGVTLLRMLLLWSVFLPIGAAWSIDAGLKNRSKRGHRKQWRICSIASIAMFIQALSGVFLFAVATCLGRVSLGQWFMMEIKTKPLGLWLADRPELIGILGWLLCVLTLIALVTLFLPRTNEFFRGAWLALFIIGHILIYLSLHVGVYPFVAVASLAVFVPSSFWNDTLNEPIGFDKSGRSSKRFKWNWSSKTCAVLMTVFLVGSLVQQRLISFGATLNQGIAQVSQITMTVPTWSAASGDVNPSSKIVGPRFVYSGTLSTGDTARLVSPGAQHMNGRDQFLRENWRRLHLRLWESKENEIVADAVGARLLSVATELWQSKTFEQANSLIKTKLTCLEVKRFESEFLPVSELEWSEKQVQAIETSVNRIESRGNSYRLTR